MSQIILSGVGNLADNITFETNPDLAVGDDDVLIELEAAVVNPVDFLYAAGWYGVQPTVGNVLGSEGVGHIVSAGSNVDAALVGRRVIILANLEQGTWADRVVAPARNVVAIGNEGDALQLAQLSINPVTAHILLKRFGALKSGDWIGQTIGNGGVGQYVIQLAKLAGYKTLSVVRSEQAAEFVRSIGGDLVVVAGENLAARIAEALGGTQLDLVLDGEGGETVGEVVQSLKAGGTAVAYSSVTGASQVIGLGDLIYREINLAGWWLVNWLANTPREEIEATYTELAALVANGSISSTVDSTFALADYADAVARAATPGRSGKVLFTF